MINARVFDGWNGRRSNTHFVVIMAEIKQVKVSNKEFMEVVARYECVYHRNSKDFKDKNKKANCWDEMGQKFNLSAVEAMANFPNIRTVLRTVVIESKIDVFNGFGADDDVASR